MSQQRMIRSSAVAAVLLAAASCDRPKSEEGRTSSAPTPTAPAPTEQEPKQAPPQQVGVTETRGATTGGAAGTATEQRAAATPTGDQPATGAAPPLPTNLPPFEGEIQMKTQGKAPESLEYAMKGDKIRLGISAMPGKNDKGVDAIIDTTDKKATILLNDRKEFVEVDLEKLAGKAKARIEDVDVERTGRTDTVSGRQCEEWKIKDRQYHVTACVTKGAPYFDLAALEQQANFTAPNWVHRIVDEGYVPLRVSLSDASGKSLASSQVGETSRKVDASKFEVPVGYRKADPSKLPGARKP